MVKKINPISRTLGTQEEKIDALIKTVNELVEAQNTLDVDAVVQKKLDKREMEANLLRRAT